MCRDLKTLSTVELRGGLSEAYHNYSKTVANSEAERFALNAVQCWVDALVDRLAKPKATLGYVYVAGPMRGIPEFNFPAFKRAAEHLRGEGWEVFSPAENDLNKGFDPKDGGSDFSPTGETTEALRSALADDTKYICEKATAIYMLRGWEKSTGANAEHALAKALGLKIMYEGGE